MTQADLEQDLAAESEDALLVRIATAEDRAAFAELFGRFAGRIKAFLIKSGSPPEIAEDVAQDVMVTIWRKSGSFDPEKASGATWIYTIARNRRIDLIRRQKRPEPDPEDPAFRPEPEASPESSLSASRRDEAVRSALASLTEDQREVVQLAFFSGLSHGEIAERLDTPLGTVKSRLRLSFARLRSELGSGFQDELLGD
ncbi:MAG: sigma-70 family RNA polymerase sigma factor [Pseudomonadota bacterium]